MKRFGVLLALLVLGSLFGTGTVSAYSEDFLNVFVFDANMAAGSYHTLYYKTLTEQDWINTTAPFVITFDIHNYSVSDQDSYQPDFEFDFFDDASNYANGLRVYYTTETDVVSSGNTKVVLYYEGNELANVIFPNTWVNHEVRVVAENGTIGLIVKNLDTGEEKSNYAAFSGGITIKGWGVRAYLENGGTVGYDSTKKALHIDAYRNGDGHMIADVTFLSIKPYTFSVTFNLKDALTGQPLSGVTVKEGSNVLGTLNDGDTLELAKGTHTLTFEKQGYWSETVTVDVYSDTTVSVQLYPDTAAFRISAPASITTFENTITEVTFTISPIKTEATYNTYMSLSGLSDIIEVKEGSNTLSPEAGKYYLGDVSGETTITVKFRASTQGTKAFTLTLTSQDALGSTTYTTQKQVTYQVEPLPFQVQLPSTWTIGENTVRINEASGQQVLITLSLLDANGSEVWTDSYSFSPYEGHDFTVTVPAEGTYTLKAMWAGYTATWQVSVNPAISIVQDTVHVKKGEIGTVQVRIKNPTSNTQYYTIELTGGFIEGNVTKQVAIAPLSEKTVEIAFSVPEQLDFDAYDLTLKVLQGSAVQYQGTVHVIIDADSGFGLALGGAEGNNWLYVGAAGAALVLVGLAVSRKRR